MKPINDQVPNLTLAQPIPVAIFIYQRDHMIYCNLVAVQLTGFTFDELEGRPFLDLVHSKFKAQVNELQRKKIINGKMFPLKILKKDGNYAWVEGSFDFFNMEGKDTTIVMLTDESRKASIEHDLHTAGARFRSFAENITDIIHVLDANFKYEYCNEKQLKEVLGYTLEELYSKNPMELIHPDDRKRLLPNSPEKLKDIKVGKTVELRLMAKDGRYIWFSAKGRHFIDHDGCKKLIAITRDISEKKKQEIELEREKKRFSVLFNNSVHGIAYHEIVLDSDGNPVDYIIRDVNKKYEEILGMSKDEVIGKKASAVYKTRPAPFLQEYAKVALTGESLNFEAQFKPMDRIFQISVISPGKYEFITIIEDVTENRKETVELRESELQHREGYEKITFYKDLLTHDIRNILNRIYLATVVLSSKAETSSGNGTGSATGHGAGTNYYDVIIESIQQGNQLVRNVELLSRLEDEDIFKESVELVDVVNQAIENVKNNYPSKEIIITRSCPEDCKGFSLIGNSLLLDVFENILDNSVKYNSSDVVEINISAKEFKKNNKIGIEIIIEDNGIGIPDKTKEVIFKRGYRDLKGGKGMGLGLSLVSILVSRFGGLIKVRDRVPGDYKKGTVFTLIFMK
ncbi:MAG: PAS domain S-box protein [Promethearchaeota archaeon]